MTEPKALQLGAIRFVNTLPLYADVTLPGVDIVYGNPTELNQWVREGQLDISPVSTAYYLQNRTSLVHLPGLSVSSFGAVESVLFFSQAPWGANLLQFDTIAVPDSSATSVALLGGLLQEATGANLRPRFQVYPADEAESALAACGNALVIGDRALWMSQQAQQQVDTPLYVHDLATLWSQHTQGLPAVFAVWVAQPAVSQARCEEVIRVLQASRDSHLADLHQQAFPTWAKSALKVESRFSEAGLKRYWLECLDFQWTDRHQRAINRFSHWV